MHQLKEPEATHFLRKVDKDFVQTIKTEMMNNPALCPQPLICLVEEVTSAKEFVPGNEMKYATIGGNHRRVAISLLMEEGFYSKETTFPAKLVFGM